jgi:hypothetical protein
MKQPSILLAIALLLGCASDKQTDAPNKAPRGARNNIPIEEEGSAQRPTTPLEPWDPYGNKQEQQAPKPEAAKAKEDDRDYRAELLSAIGSPAGCLKSRVGPDAPSEILISVEASVVETGVVTRAYASSSQLDDDELECVKGRLQALRLRAPIPNAPRSISATLELKLQKGGAAPNEEEAAREQDGREEAEQEPAAEPREAAEAEREQVPREENPREEPPADEPQPDEQEPPAEPAQPPE